MVPLRIPLRYRIRPGMRGFDNFRRYTMAILGRCVNSGSRFRRSARLGNDAGNPENLTDSLSTVSRC